MNGLSRIGRGPEVSQTEGQLMPESIMDNLQRRKRMLEDNLSKVNAAIKALNDNPKVAEVMEMVAKVM